CLARHPADRFQHPREVVAALRDPSIPLPLAAGRRRARWAWWGAAAGVVALLGVALLWWQGHRAASRAAPERAVADEEGAAGAETEGVGFEERDALIVAEFDNRSGEPSLDGALEPALVHALSRSTFLGIASRDRIVDALRLMRHPADSALDVGLARQVALRDGGIRAVLGGRVERKGPALVVTAELLAPADGAVLAGWSEAAEGVAGVQDALGRVALRIREYLGENPGRLEAGGRQLEKVTTPSLRALRLYDEADTAIAEGGFAVAEELLHEALREDPDFASAHILLAHAVRNQGRPLEESLPHAERAMELADEVPDRERYFIRGSYFSFVDDHDRMLASYRALHRLHPDHYWAANNLANRLWSLEGAEAALPYVLARARLRPNGFGPTLTAAQALILVRDRPQEAQPYVERLVDLAAVVEIRDYSTDEAAWARLWGAHRHWLRGDLEAARTELDRWAGALEALPGRHGYWVRQLLVRGYRTLGLAARAMELAPLPEFRLTRPYFRGVDAYFGGDPDAVLAELAGEAWEENDWHGGIWRDAVRAAALARSGRVDEARAVVKTFRERPSPAPSAVIMPPMMEARLLGEIELAEGRPGEAARLLEREAFGSWDDYRLQETAWIEWYGSSYFLGAQALAIAYRRLGRDEDALSVLERAVAERARSYPNGTELWLDTQLRLARLHRELGNAAEAERLENELRDLMRLADPDFWLVRALERTATR
ncbi:MAG TPA: hypothetical protein VMT16_12060, partial [Thermoanaerobaculia bacterium]|nr:hypothetical protein [Thermoanaerobaculia bacterium]